MNSSAFPVSDEPRCCSLTRSQRVGFAVFDACIFFCIIIGNTLVVLSLISYPKIRSPTNIFLASLAVADLFVALVCIPCDVIVILGLVHVVSPMMCLVASQLTSVSFSVSINHLVIVAYDRYLAVTKPLHYYTQMSSSRIVCLIFTSWAISVLYTLLPFFGWNQLDTFNLEHCDLLYIHPFSYRCVAIIVFSITPLLLMGYFYLRIYLVARKHHRRIAAEAHAVQRAPQTLKLDIKATKTVALILGLFLLVYIPASLVTVADVFFPISDLFIYEVVFFHLVFSNSAMNPIAYACRSKEFRWAFVKLLGAVFPCECWQDLSKKVTRSLVGNPDNSVVTRRNGLTDERTIDGAVTSSNVSNRPLAQTSTTDVDDKPFPQLPGVTTCKTGQRL